MSTSVTEATRQQFKDKVRELEETKVIKEMTFVPSEWTFDAATGKNVLTKIAIIYSERD